MKKRMPPDFFKGVTHFQEAIHMADKPPPPPPKKAPPPPKKAPPKKGRKGKRKRPAPPKKGQPQKKKGRRIKIKLRLKQSSITEEDDAYHDQVGWTVTHDETEDFIEEPVSKEPEIVDHQCTMCGSMMRIPRPKRDRYTVICAYPECGHEDTIGM